MSFSAPRGFKSGPYEYHQEIELTVESLTNTGLGVSRDDGWVVMTPFVIPGERIRARIHRNHKNYSEADPVAVLEPSPERVEPGCALYGSCGGCQYQHMSADSQLEWKKRQIEELFSRHLKRELSIDPVVASPKDYGYRSKITPHFDRPKNDRIREIGFHRQGCRRALLDVARCEIAMEPANVRLAELRKKLLSQPAPKKGATLLIRTNLEGVVTSDPNETAAETVDGVTFHFRAGGFFQNNPYILPAFTRYVAEQASADGARFLLDAYCGSGLFSLTAARRFEKVLGVEISEQAVVDARKNAALNEITHCEFTSAKAERIFENVPFPSDETAVILDPPRAGCDDLFLEQLFAFSPRRVVYISCNPATQLRDFAWFQNHGYEPIAIRPFDLFPQTRHLECVMTLQKSASQALAGSSVSV